MSNVRMQYFIYSGVVFDAQCCWNIIIYAILFLWCVFVFSSYCYCYAAVERSLFEPLLVVLIVIDSSASIWLYMLRSARAFNGD